MNLSFPSKKGMDQIWFILGAFVVMAIMAGLILNVNSKGFSVGNKNLAGLSSCETQKGSCVAKSSDCAGTVFKGYGCPIDKADTSKVYCCVPNNVA